MNDDKNPVFINRHGKKMSIGNAQLEAAPVVTKPVKSTPEPALDRVRKLKGGRRSKKKLVILAVVLLGLLLIPVVGGEIVRARYISSRDGAKAQLTKFASDTVVPAQKKKVTAAVLADTATRVEKIRDDACAGGLADNLATLYPRAKTALRDCITFKQKVAAIATSLRDIESQARYLESLAPVLTPVSTTAIDEFAVIASQLSNWQAFHEALEKLSPAASQRAVHEQLKMQTKTIVDTWSALNTANNNQDGAAFTAAEKKLSESYEAFRTSGESLAAVLHDSQTKLTAAYQHIE